MVVVDMVVAAEVAVVVVDAQATQPTITRSGCGNCWDAGISSTKYLLASCLVGVSSCNVQLSNKEEVYTAFFTGVSIGQI